jgi:DNA mismatch endonuclease, patch repair protein
MKSGLPPPPAATSASTLRSMQANRGRNTSVELSLRRALHAKGLRFRIHRQAIPGLRCEPDILFPTPRVAVFVDGCWWHGCPEHWSPPNRNREWWTRKILLNTERDRRHDEILTAAGWCVVRIWEHQPVDEAVEHVQRVICDRTAGGGR